MIYKLLLRLVFCELCTIIQREQSYRRFVRLVGGNVNQNTSNLFNNAGDYGIYWSSTPNSNGSNAYRLVFNGTTTVNPSDNNNRQNGYSVRCLYCTRSPEP